MLFSEQEIKSSHGRELLNKFIKENFRDTATKIIAEFDILTKLYAEINSVINISALRTVDDVYIKHYLDSIYPYSLFNGNCCDVGCGGGFPCLPLSIVTGLSFDGIESIGKKLSLIKRAVHEIGLNKITPVHARAEDVAKKGKRYDTVTARAVADVEKSLTYCSQLVNPGGKIILYKTQNDRQTDEKTLSKLKIVAEQTIDYLLPGTDIKRRLFVFRSA